MGFLWLKLAIVFVVSKKFSLAQDVVCPQQCVCSGDKHIYDITCTNISTFPQIHPDNYTIKMVTLTVVGNFTYVPANVVNNFVENSNVSKLLIYLVGDPQLIQVLHIDPEAFRTKTGTPPTLLLLGLEYFSLPSIPTSAIADIKPTGMFTLEIYNCFLPYIADFAFLDFDGDTITIQNSQTEFVEQNAFEGIRSLPTLNINNNLLTNISTPFKTLNVTSLELVGNNIVTLADYSFCKCNVPGNCSNEIELLILSSNRLTSISENAFANFLTLYWLDLSSNMLEIVPTDALTLVPTLTFLDLSNNSITSVDVNAFYNFKSLLTLNLNDNPISVLPPGAFNGLISVPMLILDGLTNLKQIDLLITYGMTNVTQLRITNCPQLSYINLTDYTKIPSSLKYVAVSSGNNVTGINQIEIQNWLTISGTNVLDISNNTNFICNPSIQWMAPFVVCTPPQIFARGTLCAGTQQTLQDYLNSFQPICA